MLDLKFVRENPEIVKQNIRNKFQDQKLPLVDEVIALDAENRRLKSEADTLRANRNKYSKMIGALMAKDDAAEALIGDMQATFDEIAAKSEKSGKTIYFEVSPLQWGLWTAGSGTFMDELATMCGVTNAFADISGWQSVSEEQVIERNPDYIVSIAGMGDTAVEEIMGRDGWGDIGAVKNGRVYNADSNAISRPGPRLKDAAIELYHFLNDDEAEEAPAA